MPASQRWGSAGWLSQLGIRSGEGQSTDDVCFSGIEYRGRTRSLIKRHGGPGMMSARSQAAVYTCRRCSSVSRRRRCHKRITCVSRPARTAPVSPQAPRVRPIVVSNSPGVCWLFSKAPPDDPGRLLLLLFHTALFACVRIALNPYRCREDSTGTHGSQQNTLFSMRECLPGQHDLFGRAVLFHRMPSLLDSRIS